MTARGQTIMYKLLKAARISHLCTDNLHVKAFEKMFDLMDTGNGCRPLEGMPSGQRSSYSLPGDKRGTLNKEKI